MLKEVVKKLGVEFEEEFEATDGRKYKITENGRIIQVLHNNKFIDIMCCSKLWRDFLCGEIKPITNR